MLRPLLSARVVSLTLVAIVLAPLAVSGRIGMVNGSNIVDTIGAAGEVDTYTFDATVGEAIVLGIGEVGVDSAFVPWIRLQRPDTTVIGSQSGVLAAQIEVLAPATGTYTVLVSSGDVGQNDTGTYTLTLAKAPGAFTISGGDEGGAMINGSSHIGNIHIGDLDMWSFDATVGDAIILGIGETGGDTPFAPWIRLKSPTGQNLGSQSGTLAAQIDVLAPVTGTYTVVVSSGDAGVDGAGSYTLTLARSSGSLTISPGDEGGPMTNGSNHTGIIHIGDLDAYSFTATAGEAIMLGVGEVGADSAFAPWIRLRSPTGQNLGSQSGVLAAQIDVLAPATGTYTVVVTSGDAGVDGAGSYTLTLAKSPGAITISPGDEGGPMTNGSNHPGTIHIGDLDAYTFTATAGESIILGVGEVGPDSAFAPWIRLRSPTGQNLGSESGVLATQIEALATASGTYTVIVASGDAGLDGTGSYTLTLARSGGAVTISPGDEGGPMTNGSNHIGSIHIGDLDAWTFTATAGEAIMIGVGETGIPTGFNPWIRLRSPTGQNLGSESGVLAQQIEALATVTGTYTVIVASGDTGLDGAGSYTLTLAKAPGAITISPGDEGGALTNGGNHTGNIHIGDLDAWTFQAVAGEALTVAVGETGPNSAFTPWIRLKSPTGQNLGSQSGVMAAQINVNATVTGTYTVVVASGDTGLDDAGSYTLTIANTPRVFIVPPGEQGGAMTHSSDAGTIHVGDVDMWTFVAHAGDPLSVTMTKVGTPLDFTPWIRLRTPTGALLGSQTGVTTAQINVAAPATGIYTVVVGTADAGIDGSGDYTLTATGISASMIKNGDFSQGETFWQFFATPTLAYIQHQVVNGVLEYYREPPPPDSSNSAVAFQHTGVSLPAFAPVVTQFDLANTTTSRKRIAVLVLDANFSDLSVCTFWLEPQTPMRTYRMRTHTTQAWANAALYFYAASAGNDGNGVYQVDNVAMAYDPEEAADRTDCVDPTTPAQTPGADGPNMIGNGDFETGLLSPWSEYSFIQGRITNGVYEFVKPIDTPPSGVVFQATGQSLPAGQIVTTTFQLGNSSNVRKRVTAILNDSDFSDLSACTFWLPPGQPLSTYVYRTFTTKPWANAMLSIYPSTPGVESWILLDNVTLQQTPSATIVGTECVEPGAISQASAAAAAQAPMAQDAGATPTPLSSAGGLVGTLSTTEPGTTVDASRLATDVPFDLIAPASAAFVLAVADPIDLGAAGAPRLTFESLFTTPTSRAMVQVSLDGLTWWTVEDVPGSSDWVSVTIDLSPFAGDVIWLRFVLEAGDAPTDEPSAWRLRSLRLWPGGSGRRRPGLWPGG
jgi:precorrin-6B methylase 1